MNRTKVDRQFIYALLFLLVFGAGMIFSASWPLVATSDTGPTYYLKNHLLFMGIGLFCFFLTSITDYHLYAKWAVQIYAVAWLLSLLVFTGLGTNQDTFARRWIMVGGRTFMPSDLVKFASIALLSWVLSRHRDIKSFQAATLPILIFIGFTVLPIYFQPDFSTTVTIALTLLVLFYIAGMNVRHAIPVAVAAIALGFLLIKTNPERMSRLTAFRNPMEDYHGDGWQLAHSLFAVSSGGIFGVGPGLSRQKYTLSQAHNDFIFAIIAEELGLIGCLILIAVFSFFVYRGVANALQAKDAFGRYLGLGIVSLIGIQALINMAVVLGLIPPTGIGFPFISYGGSSLVVFLAMAGVLVNISRQRRSKA